MTGIVMFVCSVYYVLVIVQTFLAYGTAYRKAKANGDNGVSLWGWLFVYQLAAAVPVLGIILWRNSKREEGTQRGTGTSNANDFMQ